VQSYRDTWRLFLRFVAQRAGKKVAMITLADLAASEVAGFLRHAQHERGGTASNACAGGAISVAHSCILPAYFFDHIVTILCETQ